jgi:hypothetical protein
MGIGMMTEATPTPSTTPDWQPPSEPAVAIADELKPLRLLCRWGVHRWDRKLATYNPSRLIKRCRHCLRVRVVHVKSRARPRHASNVVFVQFGGPDGAPAAADRECGEVVHDRRMLREQHEPPVETDWVA